MYTRFASLIAIIFCWFGFLSAGCVPQDNCDLSPAVLREVRDGLYRQVPEGELHAIFWRMNGYVIWETTQSHTLFKLPEGQDPAATASECDVDGDGYVDCSGDSATVAPSFGEGCDCDDNNSSIHPGSPEICNDIDDNCDGVVDQNGEQQQLGYKDADADGYGNAEVSIEYCGHLTGYVDNDDDCNDSDGAVNPAQSEFCNDGIDNNCDDVIDQECSDDPDGDSFNVGAGDCNDNDASIHPEASEVCNNVDDDCDGKKDENFDRDGDGAPDCVDTQESWEDCNDGAVSIYPGAAEVCDDIDQNCDGQVDEGVSTTYYLDIDGDGFGTSTSTREACSVPSGYAASNGDCNDANATIYPGAPEFCDGLDNDCDILVDEDGLTPIYEDLDDDGFGSDVELGVGCDTGVEGQSAVTGDCDDTEASVHPNAVEVCDDQDNNCDDVVDTDAIDAAFYYADADGDGYGVKSEADDRYCAGAQPEGWVLVFGDCNDEDLAVYPGASEVCNNTDDNCDGSVDNIDSTNANAGGSRFIPDADGDGYGDASGAIYACSQPEGFILMGLDNYGDCDDADAAINPAAIEICNGIDDNCDGEVPADETDSDHDGQSVCAGDCNDTDASVYAGAVEFSDGQDNDCNGEIDENLSVTDTDGDGFTPSTGDCNDSDSSINPVAEEVCDGIDQNCDGQIDNGFDVDEDGYTTCSVPLADCDDTSVGSYPGAMEQCDGKDNDCDGSVDEDASDDQYWAQDSDGDTWGNPLVTILDCSQPAGYVVIERALDCDDNVATTYPGATELCDEEDNNCDTVVPLIEIDNDSDQMSECEGDCNDSDASIYLGATEFDDDKDNDCDGAVDDGVSEQDFDGDGYSPSTGDCNDGDSSINPKAAEVCDGIDQNCDGIVDDGFDVDGDGYKDNVGCGTLNGDCNDADPAINPAAREICDGLDNDCDHLVDDNDLSTVDLSLWYRDIDGDGFGSVSSGTLSKCVKPSGYSATYGDCNDTNNLVYPGATEVCDGLDNDCDNAVDEVIGVDTDADGYSPCTGDCNDADGRVHPGAVETCDSLDNDCDGLTTCGDYYYGSLPPSLGKEDFESFTNGVTVTNGVGYAVGFTVDLLAGSNLKYVDFVGDMALCAGDNAKDPTSVQFNLDVESAVFGLVPQSLSYNGQLCGYRSSSLVQCVALPAAKDGVYFEAQFSGVVDAVVYSVTVVDSICAGLVQIEIDADDDTWTVSQGDCDDKAASTHPGATEVVGDSKDNDCDSVVDEPTLQSAKK